MFAIMLGVVVFKYYDVERGFFLGGSDIFIISFIFFSLLVIFFYRNVIWGFEGYFFCVLVFNYFICF